MNIKKPGIAATREEMVLRMKRMNAEYLHIDGAACQHLSALKINVLFFHFVLPVQLSLNFYRFSHFSSLCSTLILPSDARHNAIYSTRSASDSHRGNGSALRLIEELRTFRVRHF
jgi:hypothetical protein